MTTTISISRATLKRLKKLQGEIMKQGKVPSMDDVINELIDNYKD